jgi:hypothetical protein
MSKGNDMTFKEKSTALMLAIYAVVYGSYFFNVLGAVEFGVAPDYDYQMSMLWMIVGFIVLAIIGNILIAALSPKTADQVDERDRAIERVGDQSAVYALAAFCLFGMALAMMEQAHFYIAHTLLAGLVVSEMTKGVVMLWQYRRGH